MQRAVGNSFGRKLRRAAQTESAEPANIKGRVCLLQKPARAVLGMRNAAAGSILAIVRAITRFSLVRRERPSHDAAGVFLGFAHGGSVRFSPVRSPDEAV